MLELDSPRVSVGPYRIPTICLFLVSYFISLNLSFLI